MSIIVLSAGCAKRQSVSPRAQFPRWNSLHTYAQNNTRCRGTARGNVKGQGVSHASKRQACPLPLLIFLQQLQFKKPFIFWWVKEVHLFYHYVLGSSGSSLVLWLNKLKMQQKHTQMPFLFLFRKLLGRMLTHVIAPAKLAGNHKIFCDLFLTILCILAGRLLGKELLLLKPRENTHQMHCIFYGVYKQN